MTFPQGIYSIKPFTYCNMPGERFLKGFVLCSILLHEDVTLFMCTSQSLARASFPRRRLYRPRN